MTTKSFHINWSAVHGVMSAIDNKRCGSVIGQEGCCDAFGGTYIPSSYTSLADLVRLLAACQRMRHQVWGIVHSANQNIADAAMVRDSDCRHEHWSTDCNGRAPMRHRSLRGARSRATRYGGTVSTRRVVVQSRVDNRVLVAKQQVKQAVEVAILLHDAMVLFADAGIATYSPQSEICGVHDGRINLTGIRWIAGSRESNTAPTVAESLSACG